MKLTTTTKQNQPPGPGLKLTKLFKGIKKGLEIPYA